MVTRRLPVVVQVWFVCQTEDQDFAAVDRFSLCIKRFCHAIDDILWHGGVNLAGQLNETRVLPILARLPGQVEGINRDAMSAKPWSRVKRHKAEWLGFG